MRLFVSLKEHTRADPMQIAQSFRQIENWANGPFTTAGRTIHPFTLSTTAQQLSLTQDAFVSGSITNNAAGTTFVNIQLSTDGNTYTTVQTLQTDSQTGTASFNIWLPVGWLIKADALTNVFVNPGGWW